jgi:hypothetical protein
MAPPVAPPAPVAAAPGSGGVFDWHDVPQGQQVPINRAVFDQGGYQLYAASGETIAVPFQNQNLYAMKFGRANSGATYFVNEGDAPVLYLRNGDSLENASAQGARWYPIPPDYRYTQPMYVALAPSWSDWVGMGWYPGMVTYGGMWGYHPWSPFVWMPGFVIHVGGSRYYDYHNYVRYTYSHPGFVRPHTTFNYSAARSTGSFGSSRFGRSSFAGGSRFGNSNTSTGSFGSGRRTSSFGGSTSSGSGRFGSSAGSNSGSFGGSPGSSRSSGSFGGTRSFGDSFSSPRPSGGSFGGSRSFGGGGGSFGGGRSFGGGSRSYGGRRR